MWLWWQAHTALGDHDEAAADLKAVLAEDAGNREARAELKKVREAQKKAYSKQKAVFGNMFEKVRALSRRSVLTCRICSLVARFFSPCKEGTASPQETGRRLMVLSLPVVP
jgi:hypothetical protein